MSQPNWMNQAFRRLSPWTVWRATRRLGILLGIVLVTFFSLFGSADGAEVTAAETASEPVWRAGLAKVDVTPREPVRLAGYGNRNAPSEGVDSPLAVRCLAFEYQTDGAVDQPSGEAVHVLVSIDSIGLPASLSHEIGERLRTAHGIPRERLVLASTHTHCGPDLVSELSNIFSTPLTEDERAAGLRYKARLVEAAVEAVGKAIADLRPARLAHGTGRATFAANRRVLTNGRWSGFGVQPDGPVDHSVPILRVTDPDGQLRGVVYNYACHGTTLSGSHNRINGDWSGFTSENLEAKHPGIVALSTIGCGADANPEPRGTLENAVAHGKTLAAEVDRLINQPLRELRATITAKSDHAALSFELPTIEEVRERMDQGTPQARRHAERLDQVYRDEGRLPATYPVPIQAWRFGDELTMIFLGGEVVVDYALRLKRDLADENLWVTAYANDVLGYVASERMRTEGGYEFDSSAIYYGLPGPWAAGTEDNLIEQIQDMLAGSKPQSPVPPTAALETLRLSSDEFRIELVAAEPLVQDPINLAFGEDGKLWVVEMGDYPRGDRGGRVKFLEDTTGDGRYDRATLFLDQLSFPTGVFPWRDGVLVTVAPDVLFARDTNGDGRADQIESLYTGFKLANPQHRVSGFSYGLDHSLHLAAGDNQGQLTSVKTGETVNASGHDIQIWPDSGRLAITSGRTQFIRARNDWGQWFGNDNSHPLYHYPIDSSYLRRNQAVTYSAGLHHLFDPPVAPAVFPVTSAAVRFNDLYAANRFTSACSSILSRSPHFDVDGRQAAFICEPVHNLVHRAMLEPDGASYRAVRAEVEQDREFFASTDPWFRPVRCEIGPDGALWVVDMYRETIEHPEWIPQAWQAQLDLTAGSAHGRIYRILPRDAATDLPGKLEADAPATLLRALESPIGPQRDTAARLLIEQFRTLKAAGTTPDWLGQVAALAAQSDFGVVRAQALSLLDVLGELSAEQLSAALQSADVGVLLVAIRLTEPRLKKHSSDPPAAVAAPLLATLAPLANHSDARVVLALALAMGQTDHPTAGNILARIAARELADRWVQMAILSSSVPHVEPVLGAMLDRLREHPADTSEASLALVAGLLDTAIAGGQDVVARLERTFASAGDSDESLDLRLGLAAAIARSFTKRGVDSSAAFGLIQATYGDALLLPADARQPERRRAQALELFGKGIAPPDRERAVLEQLLAPQVPVGLQRRAIAVLSDLDHDSFVEFVVARWPQFTSSLRNDCVSRILARRNWIGQWLDVLEAGTVGVNDLSAAARQQLLHSGTRSMMVRAQRLLESAGGSVAKRDLVQTYLTAFNADSATGDSSPPDGAALYAKHCGVCHTPDDQGRTIGPSLANLSDRRDRALLEAILDPNLAVEPKYQSYLVRTDDDEILVGAIDSEVGETITLAKADGTRVSVDRRRVEEMKNSGVSLMPEGFEALLNPAQMEAIIRHVQRLGG